MSESERKEYTFTCRGHENIKATHVKTLEFTKDNELTERGDCIVGVAATFNTAELQKFTKKVSVVITVTDDQGNTHESVHKCIVSPQFNSNHEIVLRKSSFISERTYATHLKLGASRIPRDMVALMQNPEQIIYVTIREGWY